MQKLAVKHGNSCDRYRAQLRCLPRYEVEHRLAVAWGGGHRLQHLQPGRLCRSKFLVLGLKGFDISVRTLMLDALAIFAVTTREFGGSFGKCLQRRVAFG